MPSEHLVGIIRTTRRRHRYEMLLFFPFIRDADDVLTGNRRLILGLSLEMLTGNSRDAREPLSVGAPDPLHMLVGGTIAVTESLCGGYRETPASISRDANEHTERRQQAAYTQ